MSIEELCDLYFGESFTQTEVKELYASTTPTNSLQEMAVVWGFNKACEMMGQNPQVLLQQEKSAEQEEEFDL